MMDNGIVMVEKSDKLKIEYYFSSSLVRYKTSLKLRTYSTIHDFALRGVGVILFSLSISVAD